MICGFGDTHPSYLSTNFFIRMIQNAQANGKKEQERYFTALLKCLNPEEGSEKSGKKNVRASVNSFFEDKPLVLDPKVKAGKIEDYVSPLFYAPNVSWLVQRNGMHPHNSLMISLNASEGNHMHANGISMELYGKDMCWDRMRVSDFFCIAVWTMRNITLNSPVIIRFV